MKGWRIVKVGYAGWMGAAVADRAVSYPTFARRKTFIARINLLKAFR